MRDLIEHPPTTILFDLDGTLRDSVPGGDKFMLEYAATLGAICTNECIRKARQWAHQYWANSECLMNDERTYGRGESAFWENYAFRSLTSIGTDEEQARFWAPDLHKHMHENYQPEDIIPPDVFPTLTTLRQAGFTLGLLTNRTNPVDDYLQKVGLNEPLDFFISAGQLNSWKPNTGIFYYGMGQAGSLPSQTIYIGDNYYADVEGARNAGIEPVLIDPNHIFPDADCPVITTLGELLPLLGVS